jgi:uncharacterized protein
MITSEEKETIVRLARQYDVERILLFGSGAIEDKEYRDIDLAVDGIAPRSFFRFYSELMLSLSKPVDLVDLSQTNMFTRLVASEGVPLYG